MTNIKDKNGNNCWKQNNNAIQFTTGFSDFDAPLKLSDSKIYPYPGGIQIESDNLYYAEAKFKSNIEDDPNNDFEFFVKVIKEITPTSQPTNPPQQSGHHFYVSTNYNTNMSFNVSFYSTSSGLKYEGFSLSANYFTWNQKFIDNYYMNSSTIDKIKIIFSTSQSSNSSSGPWTPQRIAFDIYITDVALSKTENYLDIQKLGYKPVKQDSFSFSQTWDRTVSHTFTENITGLSITPGSTKYIYIMFM